MPSYTRAARPPRSGSLGPCSRISTIFSDDVAAWAALGRWRKSCAPALSGPSCIPATLWKKPTRLPYFVPPRSHFDPKLAALESCPVWLGVSLDSQSGGGGSEPAAIRPIAGRSEEHTSG